MARLDRVLRSGARWLALVGFAGLLALASMMTLDAILRTFFSSPLHGVNDVSAVVIKDPDDVGVAVRLRDGERRRAGGDAWTRSRGGDGGFGPEGEERAEHGAFAP